MQRKLLVALRLKVRTASFEDLPLGGAGKVQDPGTFGATPTPKKVKFGSIRAT